MRIIMLRENSDSRSLVFYLHLMTKHSTAAPRDLSFLIKTNSFRIRNNKESTANTVVTPKDQIKGYITEEQSIILSADP